MTTGRNRGTGTGSPSTADDPHAAGATDRMQEALLEYQLAVDAGERPPREEFLRRYAEVADQLAEFLTAEGEIEQLLAPLRGLGEGADAPPLGRFGDYELLAVIGRGGQAIVYRARDLHLHNVVALKRIRDAAVADPDALQRFRLDAELAASLDHPHVLSVYHFGDHDGEPYFTMKLIEGGSLASRREMFIPVTDRKTSKDASGKAWSRAALWRQQLRIAGLVEAVARAVHHAHQRGLLHRDLKPANVLLDENGHPYVADFGLAKRLEADTSLTHREAAVGTAMYMAPEQTTGSKGLTTAVDVYGVGAILYGLLAGRPPFQGEDYADIVMRVRAEEPVAPSRVQPRVARDLETICLTCLQKDPHKRYASAEALADDLQCFRERRPIQARPTRPWERAAKWVRRQPAVAALVVLVPFLLAYAAATQTWQHWQTEDALALAERNLYDYELAEANRHVAAGNLEQAQAVLASCPRKWRGWEWDFLMRSCRGNVMHLPGHRGAVGALAVRHDGRMLASGGADGTVRLWRPAAAEPPVLLDRHASPLATLTFGQASNLLVAAYEDLTVKVWDVPEPGRKVAPLVVIPNAGKQAVVNDRRRLIAVAGLGTRVGLWDFHGKQVGTRDHGAPVLCLAFSPDGRLLAIGGYGGERRVTFWDAMGYARHDEIFRKQPTFRVQCLAFSPDGARLALSDGSSIGLWDLRLKGDEHRLYGPYRGIYTAVAFSHDGKYLAGTTQNGVVAVWDVVRGKVVFSADRHDDTIPTVAFLAGPGSPLAYARGADIAVERWEAGAGQPLEKRDVPAAVTHLAFDATTGRLAVASDDGKVLIIPRGGEAGAFSFAAGSAVNSVAFSGNGLRLATACDDCMVRVWDPVDGKLLHTLPGHTEAVKGVAYRPDGLLASASMDRTVRLWDADGQPVVGPLKTSQPMMCVAFSPDGRHLAAGGEGGLLRLWDVVTRKQVKEFAGQRDMVLGLAFSPDGRTLGSANFDGTVRLWDVASGLAIIGAHGQKVSAVAFSPDGKRVASAGTDGFVKLWDSATGREVLALSGGPCRFNAVAFEPGAGHRLVAGGVAEAAGTVMTWDGRPLDGEDR